MSGNLATVEEIHVEQGLFKAAKWILVVVVQMSPAIRAAWEEQAQTNSCA